MGMRNPSNKHQRSFKSSHKVNGISRNKIMNFGTLSQLRRKDNTIPIEKAPSVKLTLKIKDKTLGETIALLDSGADISIASQSLMRRL